jgi:hypothetical protein
VERYLPDQQSERWEILDFPSLKESLPVIEQAMEAAGLMLGCDRSRGYCLEMSCEDFWVGANVENSEAKASTAACLKDLEPCSALSPEVSLEREQVGHETCDFRAKMGLGGLRPGASKGGAGRD